MSANYPKKLLIILFAIMTLFSTSSFCQALVEVKGTSDDMTGQRFIYLVKEGIRASNAFDLADGFGNRWQIIISTMPKDENNTSIATIYSVTWNLAFENYCNMDEAVFFYDTILGYTGRDVVESSAQTIVARTDELIGEFRKAILNSTPGE